MTTTNAAANQWIRQGARKGSYSPVKDVQTQPTAPEPSPEGSHPRIPIGNAGSGTGSPPEAPPPNMNSWIRVASGRATW